MKRLLALLVAAGAPFPSQAQEPPKVNGPLSLAQAIDLAEIHDPSLIGSRADLESARAAARESKSLLTPHLSANGFATDGSYSTIYQSSARVDPSYWLLTPAAGSLDANLSLMAPLFTSGLLESQIRSASEQQIAATGDVREEEADARVRIEDTYLRVLVAAGTMEADEAWVQAATEMVRESQAEFDAGKGIAATVSRSHAELSAAQRAETTARNDREKSLLDLKAEMGISLDSDVTLSDSLGLSEVKVDLTTLTAEARSRRGLLIAAHARFASALADVRAAQGASGPQLYGVAMSDAANQRGGSGATIGLTLSVSLFDGGERREEVAKMRAAAARAQAQVASAQLTVDREIREALLDVQTAEENASSAQAAVAASKDAYDVAAIRFRNGKGLLVEQIDALHEWTQSRSDLLQATYEHEIAAARLRQATGELTEPTGVSNR